MRDKNKVKPMSLTFPSNFLLHLPFPFHYHPIPLVQTFIFSYLNYLRHHVSCYLRWSPNHQPFRILINSAHTIRDLPSSVTSYTLSLPYSKTFNQSVLPPNWSPNSLTWHMSLRLPSTDPFIHQVLVSNGEGWANWNFHTLLVGM